MTDLHAKPELTTIPVHNPADGSVVGSVPVDTPETVATKAARTAAVSARMGSDGRQGPQAVADEVPGLDPRQRRAHHGRRPVGIRQAEGRGLDRKRPCLADC